MREIMDKARAGMANMRYTWRRQNAFFMNFWMTWAGTTNVGKTTKYLSANTFTESIAYDNVIFLSRTIRKKTWATKTNTICWIIDFSYGVKGIFDETFVVALLPWPWWRRLCAEAGDDAVRHVIVTTKTRNSFNEDDETILPTTAIDMDEDEDNEDDEMGDVRWRPMTTTTTTIRRLFVVAMCFEARISWCKL